MIELMKIQLGTKALSEIKDSYLVLPIFEDNKEDYGQAVVKGFSISTIYELQPN